MSDVGVIEVLSNLDMNHSRVVIFPRESLIVALQFHSVLFIVAYNSQMITGQKNSARTWPQSIYIDREIHARIIVCN